MDTDDNTEQLKNTLLRFNNLYNWRFFNNIKIYRYPFFRGLSKQNEIGRAASSCSLSRRPVYIKRIHIFLLIKLNINIQFWTGGHVIERLTLRIFYYIKCFGHNGNSLQFDAGGAGLNPHVSITILENVVNWNGIRRIVNKYFKNY